MYSVPEAHSGSINSPKSEGHGNWIYKEDTKPEHRTFETDHYSDYRESIKVEHESSGSSTSEEFSPLLDEWTYTPTFEREWLNSRYSGNNRFDIHLNRMSRNFENCVVCDADSYMMTDQALKCHICTRRRLRLCCKCHSVHNDLLRRSPQNFAHSRTSMVNLKLSKREQFFVREYMCHSC